MHANLHRHLAITWGLALKKTTSRDVGEQKPLDSNTRLGCGEIRGKPGCLRKRGGYSTPWFVGGGID